MTITEDKSLENGSFILNNTPVKYNWDPGLYFIKLGGVPLLLRVLSLVSDWRTYSGRPDTLICGLDVLTYLSTYVKAQPSLSESVKLPGDLSVPGIAIILSLAEGENIQDSEVQKSALQLILNCVCSPVHRHSSRDPKHDICNRMWESVRSNNGIKVLLTLLYAKIPITAADEIRAISCRCLIGLCRCDRVKQIISKLPLFLMNQLQNLMREPVLQDKRSEHVLFCKYAMELFEKVTGRSMAQGMDLTMETLQRNEIVAETKIRYDSKELLQLLYDHLLKVGLHSSASVLFEEAELQKYNSCSDVALVPTLSAQRLGSTGGQVANHCQVTLSSPGMPLEIRRVAASTNIANASPSRVTPISREKWTLSLGEYSQSPALAKKETGKHSVINLDTIVTSYLREQHFRCKNPVKTCPPFSLSKAHGCPEPKYRLATWKEYTQHAPSSITSRWLSRMTLPKFGGTHGQADNRKFIFSRFHPCLSIRDVEEDLCFTCCSFSPCDRFLYMGNYSGDVKVYNCYSGEEEESFSCHNNALTSVCPSPNGDLLMTCAYLGRPLSAIWRLENGSCNIMHSFFEEYCVEWGNVNQEKCIATRDEVARIYDVATGQLLHTLTDPDLANNYARNQATFNSSDELVLNDGVLWDVRTCKPIHKFDKFNGNSGGIFHPNGLEVIISSEIWDLRTFHLLHTVPAISDCEVIFNRCGDVIYSAMHQDDDTVAADRFEDKLKSPFGSSFRTFDARDYSVIATVDLKRNIFDLCTSHDDLYISVIENQGDDESVAIDSVCRLYEVGRCRRANGEEDEEEDETTEGDDGDDDADGSSSFDDEDSLRDIIGDSDSEYTLASSSSGEELSFEDDNMPVNVDFLHMDRHRVVNTTNSC